MKKIIKCFKTLKDAENYHEKLYNKYNKVQLVDFPRFTEAGIYTWNVE